MSSEEIKQGVMELFLKLLGGAYALPTITIAIVYGWSILSTEQIERIKELEPLLNSSLGIAFAVIVVVSYLSNIVASPIKDMTEAVMSLKKEIHHAIEAMEERLTHAEYQNQDILARVERIQNLFSPPK
jgi:hypothetical protein